MSGHQPQRPFGPPYNPHLLASSSSAVNYNMQRYPNQPPPLNNYWQGQTSSNGVSFPPNTNGYAHHMNAQSSVPPGFSAQAAPPVYSGYPAMPQYSAPPAQFFSGPPISNSSFSFAPNVPQHQVMPHQNSYEPVAHPPSQQGPATIPFPSIREPAAPRDVNADLEDGELSSGGMEKSSGDLYEKTETSHEHSAPETPDIRINELQDLSDQHESMHTTDQTPKLQRSSLQARDDRQDHFTKVPVMREQARHRLLELQSIEIGFDELVAEGFDIELLRELLIESKLPVPAHEVPKNRQNTPEESKQAQSTHNGDHNSSESSLPNVRLGSNGTSVTHMTNDNVLALSAASNLDDSSNTSFNHMTPAMNPQEPVAGKSSAKPLPGKPHDRDEYIKRLKAAKIGKTHPSSEHTIETPQTSDKPKGDASSTQTPQTTDAPAHTVSPSVAADAQREISDLETKRKAQTDLALQKMEALKAQKKLQEQAQSLKSVEKEPRPTPLDIDTANSLPPTLTENPQASGGPTPTDGRQTSYFSPVSRKPAFSIPGLFTTVQETQQVSQTDSLEGTRAADLDVAMEGDSTDTGIGPRKRLKAADFMDITPNILNRSLSNGEDAGVVIDISDDEMEAADDDEVDPLSSSIPQSSVSVTRRRENQDPLANGPPDSSTPGRLQEPQELKMKKIQIDSMNRKIQELELRIKAKQAASRVQSPRPTVPSLSNLAPTTASKVSPVPSALQVESATEDQLVQEKETQEDKLATAQAEKLQILDEGQSLPTAPEATARASREPLPSGLSFENGQQQRGQPPSDGRHETLLQEKIKIENEFSTLNLDIASREKTLKTSQLDLQHLEEKIRLETLDLERRRSELQRLAERMPILQQLSEVQVSTYAGKVDHSEAREVVSEGPEQRGEGREAGLPDASENILTQDESAEEAVLSLVQPHAVVSPNESQYPCHAIETDITESAVINLDGRKIAAADLFNGGDHSANGELEEDIMDISGSEVDEAELLGAHQQSASEPQDEMDTSDDDDFYEPPSHIGSVQQQPTTYEIENQRERRSNSDAEPSTDDILPDLPNDQNGEGSSSETAIAPIEREDVEHTLGDDFTHQDGKDEDDYEPPEADSSAVNDADDRRDDAVAPSSLLLQPISDQPTDTAVAKVQPLAAETAPKGEQFIPYESPLKQFSSYRFHPSFRHEVPGGYRSLTYSHDIQPGTLLCQHELDGKMCDDESCTSQHFEKMMLPDHIILSAMGKGEGSTPEEKDAYIEGLRSLIIDLRERKIKDLDAISEAIAHYRLQFLNDSSAKIMPLQ